MSYRVRPVAVSFSHDNKCLAVAYCGHEYFQADFAFMATIYDTETGNAIRTYVCMEAKLPTHSRMICLAFAPGLSNTLFVASLSDGGPGRLEVWCTKLASHTFEKAWGIPIEINRCEHFIVSASNSLVSCFSPKDGNIISWRLESGACVSSHKIDLDDKHFGGFIDCRGSDLVYHLWGKETSTYDAQQLVGRTCVQKLNTQTGQVDFITYMEGNWHPKAISLEIGAIAYIKHSTGVVYMIDLLQCPKTDNLANHPGYPAKLASVSKNGEMILLAYLDHVELRDVLGDIVFRSPSGYFFPYSAQASVSEDGTIVIARLGHGIHVWFVKSGKELRISLPDFQGSPVLSRDNKSMALCLSDTHKSGHEHMENGPWWHTMVDRILLWDLENNQELRVVDRSSTTWFSGTWMRFSENDQTLHTGEGDLDLETGEWKPDSIHVPIKPKRSMSDDLSWLQLNGEDVLWLPEPYRPQPSSGEHFGKNTIAYGCQDGRVVVMQCVDPCE